MLGVILLLCLVGSSYCGDSNVGIIGGHQITIERVPFMMSLRLNGTKHWCGGSIISDRFVLTAAHCIVPNKQILLETDCTIENVPDVELCPMPTPTELMDASSSKRTDEPNFTTLQNVELMRYDEDMSCPIRDETSVPILHNMELNRKFKVLVGTARVEGDGDLYDIEKIIVHPKYSNLTYNFDICLIKLSKPLTFSSKVAPITLADNTVKLHKNTLMNVTGWGSTGHNTYYSNQLQQVAIPKVSWNKCQLMYLKIRIAITHQMICAGKKGEDSCQGDSGGPLTKEDFQVGVTSFGLGCGEVPGVYVKVSSVLPWIKKTMAKNS